MTMTAIASSCCDPNCQSIASPNRWIGCSNQTTLNGMSALRKMTMPIATAALLAPFVDSSSFHPQRNAGSLPYA